MDYTEADAKLQGRCALSRKLENNTYLERSAARTIAVRLHSTNVLTFYPDGRIGLYTGGYDTRTTHARMNSYPKPFSVSSERGSTILYRHDADYHWTPLRVLENSVTIMPNGKIDGGENVEDFRERHRREDREAARPVNRARYWMRKAHGIYTDTSNCAARAIRRRWNCGTFGRWNRRNLRVGQYQCGCRVYYKAPDAKRLSVEKILAEENVSVRVAMMQVYGMEKFFLDAKVDVLDERAGYQLVSIRVNHWNDVRALKMTCPSTGAVYVNPVPPNLDKVSDGLDWMFNTENYLETVSQQA